MSKKESKAQLKSISSKNEYTVQKGDTLWELLKNMRVKCLENKSIK